MHYLSAYVTKECLCGGCDLKELAEFQPPLGYDHLFPIQNG